MLTISNFDEVFQHAEPQPMPQHHPWERIIKNVHAHKIKTAHNSVHNPHYPKKKEKPNEERKKFTVIGNRVTEEFIYCINIVKGLHKYRKKNFEAPVIRGVTGVDWPIVWNDIKIQYGGLAYCLTSQVAVFLNDKIIGGEKELKELIEQEYIYHLSLNYYRESISEFAKFLKGSGRPTVYMHIAINDDHIGTMLFMLYSDVVPRTCENFLRLCKATKGGYSGTPVHRIVKDGWIQCGGFGLKGVKMDCENFIVPPDKRGVLCMANAGRHVDCSTQFFVLLQPSPWMLHKYVAFGQLIDGDGTLRQIENVNTWYESPTKDITIDKAGILNIDCQDIMINRGAHEYIHGHIEDLCALGETLWQEVIARVFLEVQFREYARLDDVGEEELNDLHLHPTERFMKKGTAPHHRDSAHQKLHKSKSQDESKSTRNLDQKAPSEHENNDFDVSVYDYEPEEYCYHHQPISLFSSDTVKPERSYYIPLTDVPYPGEISSEYNLKKYLRGDYCLETDLDTDIPTETACIHSIEPVPLDVFESESSESEVSDDSLDSGQEAEVKKYLKYNTDGTSFAGNIVRGISKGQHDHLFTKTANPTLTDDELRHIRIVQWEKRQLIEDMKKKVSISAPDNQIFSRQIIRRQTGFVPPSPKMRISSDSNMSMTFRKVHMDPELMGSAPTPKIMRRATAFSRPGTMDSDSEMHIGHKRRQSVLTKLLDKQADTSSPTLKEYKPQTSFAQQSMLLTCPTNLQIRSDECDHYRDYLFDDTTKSPLKMARSPPSAGSQTKNSLRSIVYAKTRPSMTVREYQRKNTQHIQELMKSKMMVSDT